MKISSFHPLIVTKHEEDVKNTLAALGFEVAHVKSDFTLLPSKNTVMTDADGRRAEIANIGDLIHTDKDTVIIRINVDNLEDAVKEMQAKGFCIVASDETASAHYCMVSAPSGLTVDLCEHIRK